MAFHLIPLQYLTAAQLQVVAEQRNRNGFHAHYTGGFDASRKVFQVTCPSYMRSGCVFTTVFEYPAPSGLQGQPTDHYSISLGKFNQHEETFVKLLFRGKDEVKVEQRHNGNIMALATRNDKAIEGLHVLQFQRENVNLKMYLDGELLIPARSILTDSDTDAHVVLGSDRNLMLAPFVFYESHYTVDNVASAMKVPAFYNPNKNIFFPHLNVEVSVGGYVLWYGAWLPGIDVAAQNNHGTRLAGAVQSPQFGELTLLLKFYKDGCILSNADDTTNIPRLSASFKSISLDELYVKPDPVSFYEFKAVTGYINY